MEEREAEAWAQGCMMAILALGIMGLIEAPRSVVGQGAYLGMLVGLAVSFAFFMWRGGRARRVHRAPPGEVLVFRVRLGRDTTEG